MSNNRGMDKQNVVYTDSGILLSHKRYNAIGSNMEATSDYTKGSQTDKYHIVSLICSIKNMTHMHLSAKQTDS